MQQRSFLGGVTYFGKFIAQLSGLSAPLRKDVPWNWDKAVDEAFKKMNKHWPPWMFGFIMTLSIHLVWLVMLAQLEWEQSSFSDLEDGTERPIAYSSKTMNDAE